MPSREQYSAQDPALIVAVEAAIAQRGARRRGGEVYFLCPDHADTDPSARWNPEKRVWHCHCGAGGGARDLAQRLGVPLPDRRNGHTPVSRVARYALPDADGRVVAVHVREDRPDGSKSFWWERPDGSKGLGGLSAAALPLYGLRDLLAAPADARVIVVEGEKARDALARQGLLAVGTITGASGTPADQVLRPLLGHDVILWPDNDERGRKHMARIAQRLEELT